MSTLFESLFGTAPVKQEGPALGFDPYTDTHYNNLAAKHAAGLANSLQHTTTTAAQNVFAASAPEPHPKDAPALAVGLDAAYDLWAAKYGYEWVQLADANRHTVATHQGVRPGWLNPRMLYGTTGTSAHTSAVSVQIVPPEPEPEPEPEFDWYIVARRLVHVRAMEMHGAYFRLVPREWCK